ncbi:MAG TPA: hypothetical protein VJC17_02470 [Candidatus Dojkabacteria bacterium]|nr:hypothetical protein [Candidatus Dojkabacteria bacterium]
MSNLFWVLLTISVLFFVLLGIKALTKLQICAICLSVSLAWILLLILYWLGYFQETTLLALLMGQSILGIYYLIESKVKKDLLLFRLPFLLTLTFIFYSLINKSISQFSEAVIFLILIWFGFFIIYIFKSDLRLQKFMKQIIDCCKRW